MAVSDNDEGDGDPDSAMTAGFSVDSVLAKVAWQEHEESLSRWRQGHLVAGLPLAWVAPAGLDPFTGLCTDDAPGPVWPMGAFDAVICSQTCDLGASPPGDQHPWVLVAPLVHESGLGSNTRRNAAATGKLGYLVQVLPAGDDDRRLLITASGSRKATAKAGAGAQPKAGGGTPGAGDDAQQSRLNSVRDSPPGFRWYADLRLLVPVSKALLLSREPVDGFVTEQESLSFGEVLAQKIRRPALDVSLSEKLPRLLTEFVRNSGAKRQCFAKVEQVRLHVLRGDRLNPGRAQLLVLTNSGALDEPEQEVWSALNAKADTMCKQHGLEYAPLVHYDVTRLTADLYRKSVPVRCDLLGHTRWP